MTAVAIVHYHLGPGGVSKVITAASRAMTGAGISHVILVGAAAGRFQPARPYHSRPRLSDVAWR